MKATLCLAALPLLLLLACGGGHTSNTPTGPQSQLAASVILDTFSPGSVLAASVSVDGQEIGRSDWSTVGGCTAGCLIQGAQASVPAPGHHTVTVTILNQTAAVIQYNVRGTVFLDAPSAAGSVALPAQLVELKVGDTVKYDIAL